MTIWTPKPPAPKLNNVNPYWLLDATEAMYDQTSLHENERTIPLHKFQQTMLVLMAIYQFTKTTAPSQSGKTTTAGLAGASMAYAFPGRTTLILSTIDDQSERVLRDIKTKYIQCHRIPECRELTVDNSTTLQLACNNSKIIALPHSLKALTGNPAQNLILDEIAKWDKEPDQIYAEAIARLGATGGNLAAISTFNGESIPDPKAPGGYRGSFYHRIWKIDWDNRRNPNKNAVAVNFTYHVSPHLVRNYDKLRDEMLKSGKGQQYVDEHYLGKARKSSGQSIFEDSFDRNDHVRPDEKIPLDHNQPLFLCFDPGLNKAAVLGQLDIHTPRLVYLRSFRGTRAQTLAAFVKAVWDQVRREWRGYWFQTYADVASRKQNDQTGEQDAEVISKITGLYPDTEYQHIEPGVQAMRSFMHRRQGFYVSDKATWLIDALESGLVHDESRGLQKDKWKKDGYYEHVGDAARYPVIIITGGSVADVLEDQFSSVEIASNPYANPYTGY